MRIVYLMPGAGGTFYCENCLRDAGLIRALKRLGHDPLMVPLYLPLKIDEPRSVRSAPVFFGGINVYLQQKSALFRKTPRWLDRLFDAPWLLRWAARKAGMTRAQDLAETTLSMLRGEDGRQAKELERLIAWLAAEERPDVVCLSNVLLIGIARRVRQELRVPIVVALQDEDIFLDGLPEPHRERAYAAIAERARDADAFVAVSRYYADLLRERLGLPREKVHVVYNGISPEGYEPAPAPPDPPVIGFLERLCPEKGIDILADAFLSLRGRFKGLRLRAAGGWTTADEPFLSEIRGRLAAASAASDAEFLPNLERGDRQAFLRGLSVLSVPARHAEAFGMYIIEALASGVPVVLPRRGAFPELVEATGGGILYDGDGPEPLAEALASMLSAPPRARELGEKGRKAVLESFTVERAAGRLVEIYHGVTAERSD
jgi:glycosyltransferase involved in cell wall biosynthesis